MTPRFWRGLALLQMLSAFYAFFIGDKAGAAFLVGTAVFTQMVAAHGLLGEKTTVGSPSDFEPSHKTESETNE